MYRTVDFYQPYINRHIVQLLKSVYQILMVMAIIYTRIVLALCTSFLVGETLKVTYAEEETLTGIKTPDVGVTNPDTSNSNTRCTLRPDPRFNTAEDMYDKLSKHLEENKIISYRLNISGYVGDNTSSVNDRLYTNWLRLSTLRQMQLVAMSVERDLLSGFMTSISYNHYAHLVVYVADEPQQCFGALATDDRSHAITEMLFNDFSPPEQKTEQWDSSVRVLCNQTERWSYFRLYASTLQCYKKWWDGQISSYDLQVGWVNFLNRVLKIAGVLFVIYAPVILQLCIYGNETHGSVPYVISLDEKYRCHLHVKPGNARMIPGAAARVSTRATEKERSRKVPLQKLRKRIQSMGIDPDDDDAHLSVSLRRLHIVVDYTKLMTQRAVSAGVFKFLYSELIQCRMFTQAPLQSFCQASCFLGTWQGNFLWKSLPTNCHLPSFLAALTWRRVLGLPMKAILFLIIIPFPLLPCGLLVANGGTIRQPMIIPGVYWSSTVLLVLYIVYVIAGALLWIIRTCLYREAKFDDVIRDCLTDLRQISYRAILRMILSHILLPIEKFGIILGLLVAIPYYIVVLPVAIIISLFYGIPSVYIIGRFITNCRFSLTCPGRRRKKNCPLNSDLDRSSRRNSASDSDDSLTAEEEFQPTTGNAKTLSQGAFTYSDMFFLGQISPNTREYPRLPTTRIRRRVAAKKQPGVLYCRRLWAFLVGFLCAVFALDLIVIYAEGLRASVACLITLLLVFLGDGNNAFWRLILLLWPAVYCKFCFNRVKESYTKLAQKIFEFLKEQLEEKISNVIRVSEELQVNTGFKYFTHKRRRELATLARQLTDSDDEEDPCFKNVDPMPDAYSMYFAKDKLKVSKTGRPYWSVNNLVLFINKQDVPRIPKELFWKICKELKAPGCPGPLRRGMLKGFRQLLYMLLFLGLVMIILNVIVQVVISSGHSQFLVTIIGGVVPYMLSEVLMPKEPEVDLGSYFLRGKMEEILLSYHDTWPAYDIVGKVGRDDITDSVPVNPVLTPPPDYRAATGTDPTVDGSTKSVPDTEAPSSAPVASQEGSVVDVGHIEIEVPSLVSKPTVSSFAFWDGPALLRKGQPSSCVEIV